MTTGPGDGHVDADVIYDALRSDILTGRLSPGTPAREVALAERFGVSRTPVREALLLLEHDRLLVASSRGLVVRAVDTDEVIAIYDVRILLEGEAAAQAAEHRRESDLLRLDTLVEAGQGAAQALATRCVRRPTSSSTTPSRPPPTTP